MLKFAKQLPHHSSSVFQTFLCSLLLILLTKYPFNKYFSSSICCLRNAGIFFSYREKTDKQRYLIINYYYKPGFCSFPSPNYFTHLKTLHFKGELRAVTGNLTEQY